MIDLGTHWEFIAAAYCGAAVVVAGLLAWAGYDARATRAKLSALEAARGKNETL